MTKQETILGRRKGSTLWLLQRGQVRWGEMLSGETVIKFGQLRGSRDLLTSASQLSCASCCLTAMYCG